MDYPAALKALKPKQRDFVLAYITEKNGRRAAKKAGYKGSGEVLDTQASRMLRTAKVSAAIEAITKPAIEKAQVTAQRIIEELAAIGFSDLGDIMDFTDYGPRIKSAANIPEAARRALASVKTRRYMEGHGDDVQEVEIVEFKLWDKGHALTKLGEHVGIFKKDAEPGEQPRFQITANMTEDQVRDMLLSILKKR